MIYAMSDLHGCYEKFMKMLETINFQDDDTLYILGDIVDRGSGGIKILTEIMNRKNVVALRGNHDYLAYLMLSSVTGSNIELSEKSSNRLKLWLADGGAQTYKAFMELTKEEQKRLLCYMNSFLIYDELSINGQNFFLAHTVPEKQRMQDFNRLLWQEFIIGEPDYEEQYFADKYIVTGHTPTSFIDINYKGKIYKKNNHIAIDCGAVWGNPLGCICLDTLEEFYVC